MRIFNKEWFEDYFMLVKNKGGVYTCKGGHIADFLLLTGGIIYLLFRCILEPFKLLFNIVFGWIQTLIFGIK